jgi:hypothetical protein
LADFFGRERANDLPIWLFIFPPAKSGCEYIENAGQGQKEKAQSIWLLEELQCKRKHPDQRQTVQPLEGASQQGRLPFKKSGIRLP